MFLHRVALCVCSGEFARRNLTFALLMPSQTCHLVFVLFGPYRLYVTPGHHIMAVYVDLDFSTMMYIRFVTCVFPQVLLELQNANKGQSVFFPAFFVGSN